MNSTLLESERPRFGVRPFLLATLGIALAIGLEYGRAVNDGLFMDDYAHFRQLREADWSLGDLTDACRLELMGGVIDIWWMPDLTLRFFRPVSFGLMKLGYTLTGWSPAAMHVISMLWHLATCTLLMLLAHRLGARRALAWAVGLLFALHPGHLVTVQWIASQTELIVTTLSLGALLCFGEFRGWFDVHDPPDGTRRSGRWGCAVGAAVLFAAALGCRENAVMFPFVLLLLEPHRARRRPRGTVWLYAVFFAMAGFYFAVRAHYLDGFALPPRPYVVPPTAPDFFAYILGKAGYYLLGEFLLVPILPIGGLAYFQSHPIVFAAMTLIVLALMALLFVRNRHRLAGSLGPVWVLGFMLPVLPAFESPHHLYLPGVGWAICLMLFLQFLAGEDRRGLSLDHDATITKPVWPVIATICTVAAVPLFATVTYLSTRPYRVAQYVENQLIEQVAAADPPLRDGETVYIANLPMLAHYVQLGLERRTGARVRVVALTWAPRLLGVATRSELVRVDERTYHARLADDHFFGGAFARLLEQSSGYAQPVGPGRPCIRDDFQVNWLAGDEQGITALEFVFTQPLRETGARLFWGSETRLAFPIDASSD